jgi:hypothetical protein
MAITTLAGLQAAMEAGQSIVFQRQGATPAQPNWGSVFNSGNVPGAGTLAGTSTAAGVVPTDATTGCPNIIDFPAGKTGYLGSVQFTDQPAAIGSTGPQRIRLCDMLFKAGAYAFNAAVTLASQPSYSSRIPGADYKGTEIWFEGVTAFTGNPSITVTYTNQDGTTGRSTGALSMTAPNANRMAMFPLQAGDTGVQKIESVTATVATVGTFNILVLRPLWCGSLPNVGESGFHGPDLTDLPILFSDAALFMMGHCGITSNTLANMETLLNVING